MRRMEKTFRFSTILTMAVLCAMMASPILQTAEAEIVGLWRFDEGTGTDALDSSGKGNDAGLWAGPDGKVAGAAAPSTNPRWISHNGYGTALEFGTMSDGTYPDLNNQNWNYVYTMTPRPETINSIGTKWTIAFWINQYVNDPAINIGGGSGYQRVISCPKFEIELGVPTDMSDYFWPYDASPGWPDDQSWQRAIGATQSTGSWYHYAIVYDGSTLTKYINGSPVYTKTFTSPNKMLPTSWDTWEYLRFARQTDSEKDYFIGALDDVAIFNEALTQTQVQTISTGDFSGPWQQLTAESDTPITYIWDPSFIIRYNNGQIVLDFGDKAAGEDSWNWEMEGILDNANYYGLVNAGLWDGNPTTIEYAEYCTVGDQIAQVALGRRAYKDIVYDFTARVGGENAIGNKVGVKFYRVDADNYEDMTLIADISQTITANETWYDLSTTYTSVQADDANRFKVVCYIEQQSGNPRGTAFAYFDKVRIDVNEFLTCDALASYNGGTIGGDINKDCVVNFRDFADFANEWSADIGVEPAINAGELLANSDFYADLSRVPANTDTDGGAPTNWQFVPATTDANAAGVWNVDRNGLVGEFYSYQPAGGSVAAYIDANIVMQQTITSETIANGQSYYFTATVAGADNAYLAMVKATLEYVTNPGDASGTVVAEANFILPSELVWRVINAQYTADAASAGKYLRLKFDYSANPILGGTVTGSAIIGKASVAKQAPDVWPRQNLLVNGDFEDYSSLPMGTNNNDGWLDLFNYVSHWTEGSIPGWDASSNPGSAWYGLQSMLWAPAPQPARGRVSCWFTNAIEQKITSETIQLGQTYYVDYMAALNAADYAAGYVQWPEIDPNMIVNVYWLASGQNKPTGIEGTDWGLILSLKGQIQGPIRGSYNYNVPFGNWVTPQNSFTADASLAGKSLYVKAYCENPETPYPTFEEIFVSKQPRFDNGAYTCYELNDRFGGTPEMDVNNDCAIDFKDVSQMVEAWLDCVDPAGCP
ncbi:MAG: hypothetical protein A2Y10_03010 [Planctomycetes bacterium GWF2_41_51]|nr:MAG: hypothetical protein A2Y10_03010 [Planctomycetes bacterium GWF2_41_51]HBG27964.1 hypothetical protein [Phycisphaerales bacterium]